MLTRTAASFELARQVQIGCAKLGDVFAFCSGLYFRGKLAYARRFAASPLKTPSIYIITPSRGLLSVDTLVGLPELLEFGSVSIDSAEPRFTIPFRQSAVELSASGPDEADPAWKCCHRKISRHAFANLWKTSALPTEFLGRGDAVAAALYCFVRLPHTLNFNTDQCLRWPNAGHANCLCRNRSRASVEPPWRSAEQGSSQRYCGLRIFGWRVTNSCCRSNCPPPAEKRDQTRTSGHYVANCEAPVCGMCPMLAQASAGGAKAKASSISNPEGDCWWQQPRTVTDSASGDSTRLEGCVDMSAGKWAYPGHGSRCARPQAISLPRALARMPR